MDVQRQLSGSSMVVQRKKSNSGIAAQRQSSGSSMAVQRQWIGHSMTVYDIKVVVVWQFKGSAVVVKVQWH